MDLINDKSKCLDFKRVCCFHTGKGHFLSTAGRFIIQKVEKGSRALLFTDSDIRSSLIETAGRFADIYDIENLQNNLVQFPCKSIEEVLENKFFSSYLSKLVKLLGGKCSDEGIIICIYGSSSKIKQFMDQIEEILEDYDLPVYFINCYEFGKDTSQISNILRNHDYIIKTEGIKGTEDIFGEKELKIFS